MGVRNSKIMAFFIKYVVQGVRNSINLACYVGIDSKGGRVMSRKAKRMPKRGAVWHLSAEEATLVKKPRYNGFACGHGAHGDTKYNRARANRAWKRDMQKGPHGPFFAGMTDALTRGACLFYSHSESCASDDKTVSMSR